MADDDLTRELHLFNHHQAADRLEELLKERDKIVDLVKPQWRHTDGLDYSRGRNKVIDQVREILGMDVEPTRD